MSAQWPRVAEWLVNTLPGLDGWENVTVFDGVPTSGDAPTSYATIGYVAGGDAVGTYSITQSPDGFMWIETGAVRNQLVCTSGDSDPDPLQASVFTLADALEAEVRRDRTLGGTLSKDSQADLSVDIESIQDRRGTAAVLIFTVTYLTVT